MKGCIKCGAVKSLEDFPKRAPVGMGKRRPRGDGYRRDCRSCFNASRRDWCARNPGMHAKYNKNWHAKNPTYNQEYFSAHLAAQTFRRKVYGKNNRHILSSNSRQYSLAKRGAAPKWLTKNHREEIKEFYRIAVEKTRQTGIDHHVDHIIPINGKDVCGLHVPWNLQVITAKENHKKFNHHSEGWEALKSARY